MNKILVINKPLGWTSADVVRKVKKNYPDQKVGHAGTLDPMATGVLLVLIGKATKRQRELMQLPKEYEFQVTFGQERDTYDAEGKVVAEADIDDLEQLTQEEVEKALKDFQGPITQTVPPYSAVKVKGQRLYKLARQGKLKGIKLPQKKIVIYDLELNDFSPYQKNQLPTADIRIKCSFGTYVRSLAHDLGKIMGFGGYASMIVRTKVGEYNLNQAVRIKDIEV